jgi:hypothetical protein
MASSSTNTNRPSANRSLLMASMISIFIQTNPKIS